MNLSPSALASGHRKASRHDPTPMTERAAIVAGLASQRRAEIAVGPLIWPRPSLASLGRQNNLRKVYVDWREFR
jgi:hypothetical protein